MIKLFSGGPAFALPEMSPYVTKTEVQLKMAKIAYEKAPADLPTSPKHKMPYIHDDGVVVSDSTFIRAHVEQKYGVDLDAGLSPEERATSWAIERLIEDHLGWANAYARWVLKENFARGPAHFFDKAPEDVREKLRADLHARVSETVHRQGMGRHSESEVVELAARSLTALAALLGDKPYFMGQRPTAVDATAFGMLAALLTPHFESKLREKAESYPTLVAFVDRMMRAYYPEHPWKVASQAA
jgi:glutathione S-transferase